MGGITLGSCTEPEPWYAQLQADSPCYRVDLTDGLDTSSTVEVQDTFACLDHHGHLESLRPTAAALEVNSAAGVPAGVELARAANALPATDLDPLAMVGGVVELLRGDPEVATHAQDVLLELLYGQNAAYVRREGFDHTAPEALRQGAVVHLREALPEISQAVLDQDLEATDLLADVLEDPELHAWVWTVEGWNRSDDAVVEAPVDGLVSHLGEAVLTTRSPENDRWSDASGDSLRDLVTVATEGDRDLLDEVAPELSAILADAKVRAALPDLLVRLEREGHLEVTPDQAAWLVRIDKSGGLLQPGEESALKVLLRLLHRTNRPVRCSVNLWVGTLDIDLGNLAASLLRVLADQDPDAVQSAASLMGQVLGYGGEGVLEALAETGVCDGLDAQVVADLEAMERLGEPQTRGLTHTLIGLVQTLRDGDEDHVEDLTDVISDGWRGGLVPPLEEVVRDMGDADMADDLVHLVPVMDSPRLYGVGARTAEPRTLEDVLDAARWLVDEEEGRTGWARTKPLLLPGLRSDGTWEALHAASAVMADRNSAVSRALDLLPELVDADPELTVLTGLAPALRDRDVVAPALRLASTHEVVDEMMADTPDEGQHEVPLAFLGHLVRAGALDDVLAMVRLVLDGLDGLEETP